MSTSTIDLQPSRVELELLLRAAVLAASPAEHGREQGRRMTRTLQSALVSVAALVTAYDLTLLAGAV